MTARIKVAVRIRPFLEAQWRNGYTNSMLFPNREGGEVSVSLDNQSKSFKFDHVFCQQDNQQTVFKECGIDQLVDKAIEGYHSTIFTYGQTGSGKTYTMQGNSQSDDRPADQQPEGIIPQTVRTLFKKTRNKSTQKTFTVAVSFLQIYNERIYDLLNPSSLNPKNAGSSVSGLRLRWSKDQQFTVENLFIFECKSYEEFMQYFSYGLSNRINSCHKLNMSSSRSHSILSLRVESIDNRNPSHVLSSRIELVDLAGSERIGLTGTEGKLAKESIDINKSLFTLRQVISVLSENRKSKQIPHIPYRESKLTSILKQSIGGNSYCLMIACVSPNDSFLDENLSTLAYATKASFIHNKPTINDDPKNKVIGQLKHEIQALKSQLNQANQHIQLLSSVNQSRVGAQTERPATDRSQRLMEDWERTQPIFKRKLTQKIGGVSQDQFSQRLIESINMVRELLQSNKELREQMEGYQRDNEEKGVAIYQLERENQQLRERMADMSANMMVQPPPQQQQPSRLKSAKRQTSMVDNLVANQQPITYGNNLGPTGKFVDNTFNNFNNYQINQYYIGDKAPDSVPTNFNRRQIYSSQEARRRRSNSQRDGSETPLQKKPMTANSTARGRRPSQPAKGYGSIYINFKDAF